MVNAVPVPILRKFSGNACAIFAQLCFSVLNLRAEWSKRSTVYVTTSTFLSSRIKLASFELLFAERFVFVGLGCKICDSGSVLDTGCAVCSCISLQKLQLPSRNWSFCSRGIQTLSVVTIDDIATLLWNFSRWTSWKGCFFTRMDSLFISVSCFVLIGRFSVCLRCSIKLSALTTCRIG